MKNKNLTIPIILTLIISVLIVIMEFSPKASDHPNTVYQVYLDGEALGLISEEEDLYTLINEDQKEIIETYGEYGVDYVYPPTNFDIVKRITYNNEITEVNKIYNHIKTEADFTIKGYVATIKPSDSAKEVLSVYIINKDILKEAVVELISAFVNRDQFEAFINKDQLEIRETGQKIETMKFDENITIKETYISVDQKIFTDASELSRYLLFGNLETKKSYTVKAGDSVSSIADDNKLNEQEFLIANPDISTITTPLAIGERVSVDLINPLLTLQYKMLVVEDIETAFESELKYDNSKPSSYKDITVKGAKGIQRVTKTIQVENGVENQGVEDVSYVVIKESITEIITRGRQYSGLNPGIIIQGDTGQTWAWPTNIPYVITSNYEWRWGEFHDGIDISGTGGRGSPIYAARDGIVISAGWGGMVGQRAGYNVVIDHQNGYHTVYAHMSHVSVQTGQTVTRKQLIGGMGDSGWAYGVHLHFSVTIGGRPYNGGRFMDPNDLWR